MSSAKDYTVPRGLRATGMRLRCVSYALFPLPFREGVRGRGPLPWQQICPSPHGMKGDGASLRCVCHGLLVRGQRMSLTHPLTSGDQYVCDRQQHALRQGWLRLATLLHHPRKLGLAIQVALLFVGRLDQEIGSNMGHSSDMGRLANSLTGRTANT